METNDDQSAHHCNTQNEALIELLYRPSFHAVLFYLRHVIVLHFNRDTLLIFMNYETFTLNVTGNTDTGKAYQEISIHNYN